MRIEANLKGAAAEKLVAATLLALGCFVWEPTYEGGKHDLFFKSEGKPWTVQVKVGRQLKRRGLSLYKETGIESDLTAIVSLKTREIKWINNTNRPMPSELCE